MGAFEPDKEDSDHGEKYGVYREDYATRDEYVEALNNARFDASDDEEDIDFDDSDLYVICRVSRLDNGDNRNYRTEPTMIACVPAIRFSFLMEMVVPLWESSSR